MLKGNVGILLQLIHNVEIFNPLTLPKNLNLMLKKKPAVHVEQRAFKR